MASDTNGQNVQLPVPPPALHMRTSEMDAPGTPTREAFISPRQTPQGSPSKTHQPPGAFDLPHVFENAMKLFPTMGSPSKQKPDTPGSPSRLKIGTNVDHSADTTMLSAGSPTRRSNQENTPPGVRPGAQKESSFLTHAAQSRQEPYRTRETEGSQRYYPAPPRLSQEELEKARKPAVKRLANVTQLCTYRQLRVPAAVLIHRQTFSTIILTCSLTYTPARIASTSSRHRTLRRLRRPKPNTTKPSRNTSAASAPIFASDALV